jgi:hypothetical protein
MVLRGPVSSLRNFRRFVYSNRLPEPHFLSDGVYPEIELMICAVEKDFPQLELCIGQAIKHSTNPISAVSVIVPSHQVNSCKSWLNKITAHLNVQLQVLNEDSLISDKSRTQLRTSLGEAYGWGLQQFLTVAFVLQSRSPGVLAVNADTLVLQRRAWLLSNGSQELLVSSEYHRPYYEVLRKINPDLSEIVFTFICHQMLFQPNLLRQFLLRVGINDVEQFINKTLSSADCSLRSPFCIEFEFYAQSMYRYRGNQIQLIRFGNIPYELSNDARESVNQVADLEKKCEFNSISKHSWLAS